MAEMDAACGTKSLLLQFCPDFDECLYSGDEVLIKRFLSGGGLKIVDVEDMMSTCELMTKRNVFIDIQYLRRNANFLNLGTLIFTM